jgi:hypothetical protein
MMHNQQYFLCGLCDKLNLHTFNFPETHEKHK